MPWRGRHPRCGTYSNLIYDEAQVEFDFVVWLNGWNYVYSLDYNFRGRVLIMKKRVALQRTSTIQLLQWKLRPHGA